MNKLFKIAMPILLVLTLILSAGCAAKQTSISSPAMPIPSPMPPPPAAEAPPGMANDNFRTGSSPGGTVDYSQDRKIIKTGQITLEVADIAKAMEDVAAIADELRGYVVSSNRYGNQDRNSGVVTIRVPANRFGEAFIKLRNRAIKVPNESTNSQDVTEEYTDLQAKLHNLEATETQFLVLLEKATTVEDILKVQKELSNVRGEIDQIKGRIQYLDRTTDMSLIQVDLQETKTIGKDGWSALEILKSAVDGLIGFGKVLLSIIIWLVIFIPLWIIIGIIVFLVIRRRRKTKKQISG